MKEKIYKNRVKLAVIFIAIAIAGAINAYRFYGREPHETIGGFLAGFGLAMFIVFISLKNPDGRTTNE